MPKRSLETLEILEDGNTGPPESNKNNKKQCVQLKSWFFTWNNYPENYLEILEPVFNVLCKRYKFQQEIGESGTPHLQGNIELKKKQRWNEFKLPNEIHWEKTRNIEAAFTYCGKDASRAGQTHSMGIKTPPAPLELIETLSPWMVDAIEIIKSKPDKRAFYWYYDKDGGASKSDFCKWAHVHLNTEKLEYGKAGDLYNIVLNTDMDKCRCLFLDISRDNGNKVCWKAMENIKNGYITSMKYEGGTKLFNPPHIIIFSNFLPDTRALSKDRWRIIDLEEEYYNDPDDHRSYVYINEIECLV